MDIRDYIRMLKRGWPVVLFVATLFVLLAAAYLAVTPKRYESTAVLFVSTNVPANIGDLQEGRQFAADAVSTYTEIIDSPAVLAPAAAELRPQLNVDDLAGMVTATVSFGTTLIDITAAGDDPEQVAATANAVAASATRVIPALEGTAGGRALIRVQVIRPAVEPSAAVSPNVNRILALGFIVGACVGLGVTIATQAVDTRIRRVQDVRKLSEAPLLAVLPRVKRGRQRGLVARDEPASASGEAFRTLRTNLRFLESEDRRSLVFAAVADDCDGAFVPANLAWMLAEAGHPVLLVDLDLRQPTVGDAVGIQAGAGIADVLAGRVELLEVVHETAHPNLHVVLSGTTQPRPSELLSAPMMAGMLRRMESEYDYVILHAPPLLSYTDAAVLSGAAGGAVVTVTVGRTGAQELTTALTVLANVRVIPLGVVLTRAGSSALDHKKARGVSTRSRLWLGRPMRHRFDWDWRNRKPKPPSRHSMG